MMRQRARILQIGLAGFALAILGVHPAFAQATNGLGNVIYNGTGTHFSFVLSTGSYVIGIVMGMLGLIHLKEWVDGKTNFSDGLWRIIGGTLMIALPSFLGNIIDSFYGSWTQGNSSSYNRIANLSSNYSNNGGWLGLDQAMVNFVVDIYEPAKIGVSWASYLTGIVCLITGIYRLGQAGQTAGGRAPSTKGTLAYIIGGALMIAAGELMDAITSTLFGTSTTGTFTSLAYSVPGMDQTAVTNVVTALFAFVEVIGWIAFIRGIFLLVKIAQGGHDRTHAHAFSHIVFGAAAVNMYQVVVVIQNSLGVSLVK